MQRANLENSAQLIASSHEAVIPRTLGNHTRDRVMGDKSVPITVLLSAFNAQGFISSAMDSILGQSFRQFECIVVDAGSTDRTADMLEGYSDPRLRVIRTARACLADSLNAGLSLAAGEWVARMDADDIAHPARLERQFAYVGAKPDLVLLGTNAVLINSDGKPLWPVRYPESHIDLLRAIANGNPFPHSSVMFRRDAAIAVGGYNPRMLACEDLDLWLKLSERGRIACVQESLLFLRKHDKSKTALEKDHAMWSLAAQVLHQRRRLGLSDFSAFCSDDQWSWFLDSVRVTIRTTGYSLAVAHRNALSMDAFEAARRDWAWLALSTVTHPQRVLGALIGPLRRYALWRCLRLVSCGPDNAETRH